MISADETSIVRDRIKQLGILPDRFITGEQGMALICHVRLQKSQSIYENNASSDLLSLDMCTANVGKAIRFCDNKKLEGIVKPGTVCVSVPQTVRRGSVPKMNMLGIAVCLNTFNRRMACDYKLEQFLASSTMLYNDPVMTSVMQALWQDAQVHDEISAFFEHGIAVILKRLVELSSGKQELIINKKLSPKQLKMVTEFIENKAIAGNNICVKEMAMVLDLEPRTFCRNFSATTGMAPYAYFTNCRIKIAQRLLTETNLNITTIANELGYSNASKFSGIFKKNTGFSPRDWKRCKGSV